MITGGHNNGRVGTIVHKEKHKGDFDIVHVEDAAGNKVGGTGMQRTGMVWEYV